MNRQPIHGLLLFGLMITTVASAGRAQPGKEKIPDPPDRVEYRDPKDGKIKSAAGLFKVSPAGFQVVAGAKLEPVATFDPDDLVSITIGNLDGVDRNAIQIAMNKENEKKDYKAALNDYQTLAKKAGLPDRSKRYLDFKIASLKTRMVDELDETAGWKEQTEQTVAKVWNGFLIDHKTGWELWPAVRITTRMQMELGRFDDAARTWKKIIDCKDMPPEAITEARIQELDLNFRAKQYAVVATSARDLMTTVTGVRKERLAIYEIAATDAGNGKPLEAVDKVKALMDKTKNPAVHATGFSVAGELYLAAGKLRDAMWMFLWVETVTNQDRDEVLKAMVRLYGIFNDQMDEQQTKKYADKLKQFRTTY